MSMREKLRELSAKWRRQADDTPEMPEWAASKREDACDLEAILAEPEGEAVAYVHRALNGSYWIEWLHGKNMPDFVERYLYTTPPAPTADKATLTNPYTGTPRDYRDVESDPEGVLIVEHDVPLKAATADKAWPDGAAESRFFIDHGIVHDRKTGKHLRGTDEYGDRASDLLAVLQELEGRSLLQIPRAKLRQQIANDPDGEPEASSPLRDAGAVLERGTRVTVVRGAHRGRSGVIHEVDGHAANVCLDGIYGPKRFALVDLSWRTHPAPAQVDEAALYNELLMAVANKYPGETRHQTALRYINERESPKDDGVAAKEGKR